MPFKDPAQRRQYQRERVARARAEWLAGKSCVICGSAGDLQIDHIDPKMKVSHRIWSWTPVKREAELAKCQVLCLPHHKEKTRQERTYLAPHGTDARYTARDPCRCDACCDAHRQYKNAWRARRRAAGLRAS